ncbi:acetate--CoA ligase family protein [Pseudofrankia sp. DC12]|uniref:acetate--CoA ligase family protein n=1 Tax=Pseudofrankia sp. DC12 TaxID=683315 RepID=UPI0005F8487F|nr:acetate--CoA ligase family protein [Pseudofrankia sp. DC12]
MGGGADLSRLVDPASVVVVGASDRAGSLGARAVENLLDHSDFTGRPYLVSRTRQTVHGLACYPSVLDLPEAPDAAMLLVPAAQTLPVLRECADRGVRYAIVFTSGFGETGPEGRAAEAEMARIGRAAGMRLYGPNSPGLCNLNKRIGFMFSPSFHLDQRPGPIGLATQGGGIGRCFLQAMERGVGVGLWASTGNEVDLTVADFVRYLADADDISVIATAIEGVRNGPAFVDAALYAAERGKPVVALKVGRSDYGARAVASHTGSLSGAAAVNSAVLRQIGVVEVDDMDELIESAALFARRRPTGGERVAVYGFSGGGCALSADAVGQAGLELATFTSATDTTLRAVLPDYAAVGNPVDATSDILTRPEIGHASLQAVADDPDVGVVLYPFPCDYAELTGTIAASIAAVQRQTDTPILPVWMSDRLGPGYAELVDGGLVPVRSVRNGVAALRRWVWRGQWRPADGWRPLGTPASGEGRVTLTEPAAKELLGRHGVAVPVSGVAGCADEAVAIAGRVGYPVVVKVVSEQITHKSDVGGVALGLEDAAQVRAGHERVLAAARAARPDAGLLGTLVEPMAPAGLDVLVGVTGDPVFGPVLTFGLGGVLVELFDDAARRLLPLDLAQARALIDEPRCAALLRGVRGAGPYDVDALAALLVAVSRVVERYPSQVVELELNPVRVLPAGQGVLALDAVLVVTGELEGEF